MKMTHFYQIAQQYFPGNDRKSASNRLSRWIRNCKPLLKDLHEKGRIFRARYVTPWEIERIYFHLGEP